MVAMCQANRAGIAQSFRQVMGQFENENVQGFLEISKLLLRHRIQQVLEKE